MKAFTLLMTRPRILPEVVSTTGPADALLMSAAVAFTMVVAANEAVPMKDLRLIFCIGLMEAGDYFTPRSGFASLSGMLWQSNDGYMQSILVPSPGHPPFTIFGVNMYLLARFMAAASPAMVLTRNSSVEKFRYAVR